MAIAAFVALSLAVYARVLNGWFLSDDVMIAVVIPDGKHVDWAHVWKVFGADWGDRNAFAPVLYYRPLVVLTQALDAVAWGVRPFGYHLTNVVLHGVNGFLLYRVARAAKLPAASAAFAGALFVVFPWHVESVAWISGRTDVLATTWALVCLGAYLEARGDDGRRRWELIGLSLGAYALALLSKDPSIALPGLIAATDLAMPDRLRGTRRLRDVATAWCAFAAVTLVYLWIRIRALGSVLGGANGFLAGKGDFFHGVVLPWEDNFGLLFAPYNRESVGALERYYAWGLSAAWVLVALACADALRTRRVRGRVALLGVLWFVLSVAPFARGIHVEPTLQNARFLYLATAAACLFVAALAVPALGVVSAVAAVAYLSVCIATLENNEEPWIWSGDTMRTVTATYGKTFGWHELEPIEQLPERHQGAYLALYNAESMKKPLVLEPPKAQAVASERAVFDPKKRDLRILSDPAYRAADLLERDRAHADWLLPLDGSAFDTAGLESMVRDGVDDSGVRHFRAKNATSWFLFPVNEGTPLSPEHKAEERAYLLLRPEPPLLPRLFWVSKPRESFGAPRYTLLRQELTVVEGRALPRTVNGFFVYSAPLSRARRSTWPGLERVTVVRLDPSIQSGPFEIGFFGIARFAPNDPR
ncbi:MAG TPA: hypothetical protein VH142_17575 [Polyangiaceae bacterium]|jgi:hypothetical protein|nr:hypothetical protein [Polyangiaceae bacterium]